MKSCAVCKRKMTKENGTFFCAPKCEIRRQKWSAICQVNLTEYSRLCMDHFSRSQVITAGQRRLLMPNAEPIMQNQQNEVLTGLSDASDPLMISVTWPPLAKPFQEYPVTAELPMEKENNTVGLFQGQQTQIDSSISYDVTYHHNKIKKLKNKELKYQLAQTNLAVDSRQNIFTDCQNSKLMGPDDLCRICAKTIKGKDALGLFENENNILLLKINDLTGVQLTNETGLPKLICLDCNSDILEAYKKFREDFLKVQASFNIHIRGNKQLKCNRLIKESEFVVEEETNISVSNYEPIFEEEKEINTRSNEIVSYEDTNDFELNSCDDNALEDTKNAILEYNIDEIEAFIDLEVKDIRESDEEFCEPIKKLEDVKENPKVFVCDQCGNQFYTRKGFDIHLRRHSGIKRYACEICPYKFFTSADRIRHMRKHTGERPYPCKFCGRRYTDSSTRTKHQRTHTNERPFTCHLCGKSFTSSYILKNHMLTHTGEKGFKCDLCNREFGRKTNLDAHFSTKMHKEALEGDGITRIKCKTERRFTCSVCDRSFKEPYILRNHMLTHTGVKDFKCVACNKAFARKCQLDAHFTTKTHRESVENTEHLKFEV